MKKLMKVAVMAAVMGWPAVNAQAFQNPDSVDITVTINNALSVNVENGNFTSATGRNLGDSFTLPEVISVDNDSNGAGAATSGFLETYQLSAALTAPAGWSLSSDATAGNNDLVLLAVFSSAGSAQPADGQFNSGTGTDDLVTTTAATASDTNYYGTGASTGKSGMSVSPAAGSERNLWLRILLPTTSTVTGNATVRLFVFAQQG